MVEVGLWGEAYASMRRSSFHAIGSEMGRRWAAPQPVFARYKRLEIERIDYVKIQQGYHLHPV
jgi:hypothetical protein